MIMYTKRLLPVLTLLVAFLLIPLVVTAAISPPVGIVAPPDPLRFQIEYCWDGWQCGTTIVSIFENGRFVNDQGHEGIWVLNERNGSNAHLYDDRCRAIYIAYMENDLKFVGEMYCQSSDEQGTWTGVYLPAGTQATPTAVPSIVAAGPAGDVLHTLEVPDSVVTHTDLESCWDGGYPCGNITGLHMVYPECTFWTDDGSTGLWVYNMTAGTSVILFNEGCEPAYIGHSINGVDSMGTMHCLNGSWKQGEWGTHQWFIDEAASGR